MMPAGNIGPTVVAEDAQTWKKLKASTVPLSGAEIMDCEMEAQPRVSKEGPPARRPYSLEMVVSTVHDQRVGTG
ncbi:hypothetical protein Nepgr_003809 [Nepenthes gracilis]|uniref:Uncharacterized protein n=1 Tax=Nepenthes gracilis TaxID=150966 RepID=A0AAD3S080_NEPGR|nr:hypothetical protein Nepgr_003809 [Nepenthes gracilis]